MLAAKFRAIFPHLDERQRRLLMGAEARALGHGGIRLVARAAGVREATVSLGVAELRRVGQLASTLSGPFIPVDSQILISSTRAVCLLRAGSATFGAANVSVSTIANIQPNVVALFRSRTAITVAFWLIGKTLRSVEGAVLALRRLNSAAPTKTWLLSSTASLLIVPAVPFLALPAFALVALAAGKAAVYTVPMVLPTSWAPSTGLMLRQGRFSKHVR